MSYTVLSQMLEAVHRPKRVISLFRKNAQETVHRLSMVNEQLTAYFSLCEHLGFSLDLVVSNAEVF